MPISTLQSQKAGFSKSTIITVALIVLGLAGIFYFGSNIIKNIAGAKSKGAISVLSANNQAEVYINGSYIGTTPYEARDLKTGENKITVKNGERQYSTTLNFLPNIQVVINRDLGVSDMFSSGQDLWMEKSGSESSLSVISEPAGASVFIDNTEVGKTPYSSNSLTEDEYDLRVEYSGYETQTSRIKVQKGYNLNVSLKLFPIPVPSKVATLQDSNNLYNLITENNLLTADTANWVKAILYWNQTRGINLSGMGVNKENVFDYYLDYKGDLYTDSGAAIVNPTGTDLIKKDGKGAYLGKKSDGDGLSEQAKQSYQTVTGGAVSSGKMAKVKETGTGWLRVRDQAGLNGVEVAKVTVGESYAVLEENTDWAKIKVSDTVQGWVSKAYVDIK